MLRSALLVTAIAMSLNAASAANEADYALTIYSSAQPGQINVNALANYGGFRHRGFAMRWVFDIDVEVVGKQMAGIAVQHLDELEETVAREHIQIAIISVPARDAQEVADRLITAGVRSILSYAPISLRVPEDVHIAYSDPVVQLQHMTYYLDS